MTSIIASIADTDVFQALHAGQQATEILNKRVNIDNIEEIFEKMEDQKADAEERADVFIRMANAEDNEDLLDELNELEADVAARELEELEIGAGAIKGN